MEKYRTAGQATFALHAGYLWLQTHTHNMLFNCNNVCTYAPHCYVIHTLPVLFYILMFLHNITLLLPPFLLSVLRTEAKNIHCEKNTSSQIQFVVKIKKESGTDSNHYTIKQGCLSCLGKTTGITVGWFAGRKYK